MYPMNATVELAPDALQTCYGEPVELLKSLIEVPSFSGEEAASAEIIQSFLGHKGVPAFRRYNNVWCYNRYYDALKPTILLNSHHDTVRPATAYTRNPFFCSIEDGKMYGLGSNDAGGCLVSLLMTFLFFFDRRDMAFNLCFAATGEEETSGEYGIRQILPELGPIAFAIVGEPTKMDLAVAEMGSMVLDCVAHGKAGHAARNEGDNAIYKALRDIQWFSTYRFPRESGVLGPVKLTVTELSAGIQSNVVPSECRFTVDVRLTDNYSVNEVMEIIRQHTACTIDIRPGILKPSSIDSLHPLVKTGKALGLKTYVSPTSSDRGWLTVPSVKMGPGDSARSHMADEYIGLDEISEGIQIYKQLLQSIVPYLVNNPEFTEKRNFRHE